LAQAENDRADYQRDLIVSWAKMSEIEPVRARELLSRAFDIACRLHDEGRLAPADAWLVDELARRLGEAAVPAAETAAAPSLVGRIRQWMGRRR
jgi:hypothetical protein